MTKHDNKTADELILDNAPEGNYKSVKMLNDKPAIWVPENYRSLADITELVELRKKNAELEKALLKSHGWIAKAMMQGLNEVDCSDELLKIIAIRDLEQQAKGIEDALSDYDVALELLAGTKHYKKAFANRAKKLLKQAKQLKGGDL